MLNKTKGAGAVAADRATALLETVRPIVTRAMSDPELHQALRNAFATGREVGGELSGKTPGTAAKKIARDRKLQAKVETAAQDLQKAVTRLTKKQKKERKRRLVKGLALLGAAAGAVVLAMRKFRGGGEPSA